VIRLALRVRRVDAELVLADLLELAPSGVEEIELPGGEGGETMVEYAVYGAPGELPALPDVRAVAGGALVDISTSEVADDWSERWKQFHQPVLIEARAVEDAPRTRGGAAEREIPERAVLRARHAPADGDPPTGHAPRARGGRANGDIPATARHAHHGRAVEDPPMGHARARGRPCLFVRPPWEAPCDRADVLDIVIDPAQAFGTGAHATTRMCLELLLELAAAEGTHDPLLDMGSGSGVLAIAALKLGYRSVLALDNDRESVRAILANAAVNDVELEARCFDLRRELFPWLVGDGDLKGVPVVHDAVPTADRGRPATGQVVLANLLRPLLIDLAEKIAGQGVPAAPTRLDLIASGLLREQADEVAEVFAKRLGLNERARLEQGEWSALWLAR
jgi:ribosomal protein L11 methylase PrmA